MLHRTNKDFARTIADRSGNSILSLWESWSDRLDIRCAGSALRAVAKSIGIQGEFAENYAVNDDTKIISLVE